MTAKPKAEITTARRSAPTKLQQSEGETTRLPPLASPLKWAGGKRWLAPRINILYEPYRKRRLVEPFCGGLGISLQLRPERALLNDFNEHLINFYKQVRKGWDWENWDIKRTNSKDQYYRNRTRFNTLVKEEDTRNTEAAQLFYYLNRTCFNGLCRFSKSGFFNVPFGSYKTVQMLEDLEAYKRAFAKWQFTNVSFEKVPLKRTDFVYADPPYDTEFRHYSPDGFTWEQQQDLARFLANHPGPVVLSNSFTKRIRQLYARYGFDLEFRHAPRRISSDGDRSQAWEIVAGRNLGGRLFSAPTLPAP